MFERDRIHPYTPIKAGTIKPEDYFNRRTGCQVCGRPKQPGDALYCLTHRVAIEARCWGDVQDGML